MKKVLLFACIFSLFACAKDETKNESSNGNVYVSNDTVNSSRIMMYTSGEQIEDLSTIRSFISRNIHSDLFIGEGEEEKSQLRYKVSFIFDGNSVTEKYMNNTFVYDTIQKDNNITLFVKRDTVLSLPLDTSRLDCFNINRLIGATPAPVTCKTDECTSREQFPVFIAGNKITRQIINYFFIRKSATQNCDIYGNWRSDYFNYGILSKLQPGDTLVFQTASYSLYKQ